MKAALLLMVVSSCVGFENFAEKNRRLQDVNRAGPDALTASPGDGQVTLTWTEVEGALGYVVYAGNTPDDTSMRYENAASPYVVTGLTNQTTYYFRVAAVLSFGESELSAVADAMPSGLILVVPTGDPELPTTPVTPANFVAAPGNMSVTLSWTAVANTTYTLYWKPSAGVTKTNATVVTGVTTPTTLSALSNGTGYHFRLMASRSGLDSGLTPEIVATPLPPPIAPTGVYFLTNEGYPYVQARWNGVPSAGGYRVYMQPTPGVTTSAPSGFNSAIAQYDFELPYCTTYYVAVSTVAIGQESALSPESAVKVCPNGCPPPSMDGAIIVDPVNGDDSSTDPRCHAYKTIAKALVTPTGAQREHDKVWLHAGYYTDDSGLGGVESFPLSAGLYMRIEGNPNNPSDVVIQHYATAATETLGLSQRNELRGVTISNGFPAYQAVRSYGNDVTIEKVIFANSYKHIQLAHTGWMLTDSELYSAGTSIEVLSDSSISAYRNYFHNNGFDVTCNYSGAFVDLGTSGGTHGCNIFEGGSNHNIVVSNGCGAHVAYNKWDSAPPVAISNAGDCSTNTPVCDICSTTGYSFDVTGYWSGSTCP